MRTEETPIANPSEADEDKSLYQFQFGAYGDTKVYVWADSDEDAFEIAVEWVDDHAPGVLTSLDEGDLKAAAEDEGVEWKDSWPDYDDEEFQRVIEAAEADLTVIGHTSLKHGQYIPSWEWHFHEVTDQAEREAVAERAEEDEEDDGEQVANGGSGTWKVEVDQIPGPGMPLYVPILLSPDGTTYRYRALKSHSEALALARRFAKGLNDPSTSVLLNEWRPSAPSGGHARNGRALRASDMKPGHMSIVNTTHPEWGTWGVLGKYAPGIWEIRGRSGARTLSEDEFWEWELAPRTAIRSDTRRGQARNGSYPPPGGHARNGRRRAARAVRHAAYFQAGTPANYRWLMQHLVGIPGVRLGSESLTLPDYRGAPLVFDFDPRQNGRVQDALRAAEAKIEHCWQLPD